MSNKYLSIATVALLLYCSAYCDQYVPIPKTQGGFRYPSLTKSQQPIRVDLYMDLCCSACKAFYPEFKSFIQMPIGSGKVIDALDVHFHFISLPYHTYSFLTHKLQNFIFLTQPAQKLLDYIDTIFANQDKFLEGAQTLTQNQVIDQLVQIASDALSIEQAQLRKAWDGREYQLNARTEWKDAVYNQVVGTPGMKLNGVLVQDHPFTAQGLYDWLKPYLVSANPELVNQ